MFKRNDCSERFPQLQYLRALPEEWLDAPHNSDLLQRLTTLLTLHQPTRPAPSLHSSFGPFPWHHPAPISRCSSKNSWEAPETTSSNYRRGFQRLTAKNSWINRGYSVECQQEGNERSLERPRKREKKMACSGIGESETGMSERDRLWIIQ